MASSMTRSILQLRKAPIGLTDPESPRHLWISLPPGSDPTSVEA
jgi:hypothetical protein